MEKKKLRLVDSCGLPQVHWIFDLKLLQLQWFYRKFNLKEPCEFYCLFCFCGWEMGKKKKKRQRCEATQVS